MFNPGHSGKSQRGKCANNVLARDWENGVANLVLPGVSLLQANWIHLVILRKQLSSINRRGSKATKLNTVAKSALNIISLDETSSLEWLVCSLSLTRSCSEHCWEFQRKSQGAIGLNKLMNQIVKEVRLNNKNSNFAGLRTWELFDRASCHSGMSLKWKFPGNGCFVIVVRFARLHMSTSQQAMEKKLHWAKVGRTHYWHPYLIIKTVALKQIVFTVSCFALMTWIADGLIWS